MRIMCCLLAASCVVLGCNRWLRTSRHAPCECLAVGQQAPEIEGVDLDSVPFKLSDYRGKVVVLDFWGHW